MDQSCRNENTKLFNVLSVKTVFRLNLVSWNRWIRLIIIRETRRINKILSQNSEISKKKLYRNKHFFQK